MAINDFMVVEYGGEKKSPRQIKNPNSFFEEENLKQPPQNKFYWNTIAFEL